MASTPRAGTPAGTTIHPDTAIGAVRLTVADAARSSTFYEEVIGLRPSTLSDGAISLDVGHERPLIELLGDPAAPALDRRATGLFHLAMLVPSRRDLAFALARLADARWPLDGAADHLVSEALYLSDPDGNGIEICRDRPREQWPRAGNQPQIATLPLDLDALLGEVGPGVAGGQRFAPSGTAIGHVHLQVADLDRAEAFYNGVLGFEVTARGYPGALFVSAGGYHHHVGLNTWYSAGSGSPASGSVGLRSFEVELPDRRALERVLERVQAAGIVPEPSAPGSALVSDPSGNRVLLRAS